jgi:hypothetical protein
MTIHFPRQAFLRLGALLAVGVVVAACAGAAAPQILSTVGSAVDAGRAGAAPEPAAGSGSGSGSVPGTQGGQQAAPVLDAARPDLLIIKTGTLDLQVSSVNDGVAAAAAKIAGLGGYVSGSEQAGEGDQVSATVTYRIPVERWQDALTALRGLAIKVVGEKTDTQDVTGQVVDLSARIAYHHATVRAVQDGMTKARTISDILTVQAELTKVRGDIEQAVAEKQHLAGQAAFSTLTVGFGLKPEAAVVVSQQKFDPKSEVDRASATMVDILQGLATAGIWFAIVWLPILIVLGIVASVVAFAIRRGRPRRDDDMPMTGGSEPPASPPPPIDAPAPAAG